MFEKIITYIDLHFGEENKTRVLENVKANTSFRGSNLWILACAIVIASVGLNVNSTAVVIGAMLISPLMGPIIGAGFGLGTYNFVLLKKSLKNLLIATAVSLLVSATYFYLSPFKETQSELLARTTPNIYDVIIAFFGGLAGVVAITRVEKGNPIPGVAIATALMPPLCTAGYGLAIGKFSYLFGALLLYTINCVFICIATFTIVKYLKYPAYQSVNEKEAKKIKYIISFMVIVLIVPSIFFAYQLVQERKFIQKADIFINDFFVKRGYTVIYKNINPKSDPREIELAFLSKKIPPKELVYLNESLSNYDINNARLIVRQDTTDIRKDILTEINRGKSNIDQKEIKIASLEKLIQADKFPNNNLIEEVKIFFPKINSISVANHYYNENTDSARVTPIAIYKTSIPLNEDDEIKLKLWLKKRLRKNNIEVYSEN